jgi:hypothetical protein
MLLGNYSILNRNADRLTSNTFANPLAQFKATQLNGFYCGEHVVTAQTNRSAFNNGYSTTEHGGYAWWMAPVAGGVAANRLDGVSVYSASVAGGVNGESDLSGAGEITQAEAGLIVSAIAAIVGSGDVSSAVLNAVLPAIANLSGSGDTSTATINAIASLLGDLVGSGTPDATIRATGALSASVVVTGDVLSTSNVADAVWSALSEGNFSYAQVMQIIAATLAGKTSNSGQTFRDLSDSKDRVTGTVTGGERTAVTYDLD